MAKRKPAAPKTPPIISGDDPVPAPDPTPTPLPPVRTPSPQDVKMAAAIADAKNFLTVAGSDPEIAPLLAVRSYDAAKIAAGLALQAAAQDAYTARQTEISAQDAISAALSDADDAARAAYSLFRENVRAAPFAEADVQALGVQGRVPLQRAAFLTMARAGYDVAATKPYSDVLKNFGYKAADLGAAAASLDALEAAAAAQNSESGDAKGATKARNDAFAALDSWMGDARRAAKLALKGRDDLLRKLAL